MIRPHGEVLDVPGVLEVALHDELLDLGVELPVGQDGAGAGLGEAPVGVAVAVGVDVPDGDVGVVERFHHLAEDGEEFVRARPFVDRGPVPVAYGVPVDALGREEGVVLLEGLPEDVEGSERIPGGRTGAGSGQFHHPAQVPFADVTVQPDGGAVAVAPGAHGEDGVAGRGVGAGAGALRGVARDAADGGGLVLLESSVPDGQHGAVAVGAPDSVGGRIGGRWRPTGCADEGQGDGGGRDNAHDLAFSVGDLLGTAHRRRQEIHRAILLSGRSGWGQPPATGGTPDRSG